MVAKPSTPTGFESHRRRAGIFLVSPAIAAMMLTSIVPLILAIGLSFTDYDLFSTPSFNGLTNYQQLFSDSVFWQALGNTISFAFGQVVIGVVAAIGVALLFNQNLTGGAAMRTIVYIPQAASYVVVALLWNMMLDPAMGPFSRIVQAFGGGPVYFLSSIELAMPSIVVVSLWRNIGYFMIIILAALKSVPKELLEAAALDGAGAIRRFFYITLPEIRSAVVFVAITWFLGGLQMFTQSYVMTGGGPINATKTLVYIMYDEAFSALNIGKASAIAVLLFGAVVVLSVSLRAISYLMRRKSQ
ncbi:sugar ABC transporter permease [Devosia rhodophyticola]|uniref:Sugar ABC transporter permease n=1 Tax=Devosia rhodophyticola TaxID=3026423 RepID=A0ABY7YW80_9HYPH|nr:sugar ABC transporter permease [Devosia rhodophyticola]WDR05199.1 sugar ABC transporter permease [Devosia rhodophyticola]